MKTSDLIEARGAIVARMNAAHEADDNAAFQAAESELRGVDAKLDRVRAGHLVHQVKIDVEQIRLPRSPSDDVIVPDLLRQRATHGISFTRLDFGRRCSSP